jgi:hypothetical protein
MNQALPEDCFTPDLEKAGYRPILPAVAR